MEWIGDPTAWLGLGTLILLEIVLGIDNLIFIAILVDKLPPAQRKRALIVGLSLALLMRIAMLAGHFFHKRPEAAQFIPRKYVMGLDDVVDEL